ncbi:hypothetical protein CRM22_001122 [Opisthorchis felineus]|uniref:NADP-dependent oxidoreductase domain-containing protein n=1 Tax=Opisthorchis felineus TaxID=147828 RepID=A0A4S2MGB5_OPIFE|nr:hypothetical protein CRM22_001122 [Opisthorchis felineus]
MMENDISDAMTYRNLGNTGLRVSALGLGTKVTFGKQISDEMAEKIVTLAYNKGVNFFETSEAYGNGAAERTLGKILKNKSWRRSSYVISTRLSRSGDAVTEQGISRKRLVEGLRGSLDRLQLEYVDIIIVTRQPDTHIPIEDVVRTCTHLIELGWAFYWGTCKWTPAEIMQAQSVARQFNLIPAAVEQTGFHILQRERLQQMQEMCVKLSILSGKYCDGIPTYSRACLPGHQALLEHILSPKGRMHQTQVRQLCKLASRLRCTCAQLAIAWCLKTPTLSCVLLGAATVDQLQENLEAIQVQTRINFTVLSEIERILSTDSSDSFL